jgi:[NiFe] hydrogenase assembly HybE family chaperone
MSDAPRFEGSYMGAAAKISPAAVMECKICWTPYDPAEGDETRQVPPGTPFLALPHDWKCPVCDGAKDQFMVLRDEGRAAPVEDDDGMRSAVAALVAEFREIHNAKMRDVPFSNKALHVEAVGFRPWNGHRLGVLVTPWFMNLTILPGPGEDWSGLKTGAKELIDFPSGTYEFIHTLRPTIGGYKGCSLFSPMADFASQLKAVEVARAVMVALFDAENREETDRAATIRRQREEEVAAVEAPAVQSAPSRRAVITGGIVRQEGAD